MAQLEAARDGIAIGPIHEEKSVHFATAQRLDHVADLHARPAPGQPFEFLERNLLFGKRSFGERLDVGKIASDSLAAQICQSPDLAVCKHGEVAMRAARFAADRQHGQRFVGSAHEADDCVEAGDVACTRAQAARRRGGLAAIEKLELQSLRTVITERRRGGEVGLRGAHAPGGLQARL